MRATPTGGALAGLGIVVAMLAAGCTGGGDEGVRATLVEVSATEYVTIVSTTSTSTTTTTLVTIPGQTPGRTTEELHTIVAGDSLARISSQYDVAIDTICSYNGWPDCIDPPHLLLPGDTVRIPPDPAAIAAAEAAGAPADPGTAAPADGTTPPVTGVGCTHTIQLGENPTLVANRYDLSFDQLQAANPSMDFTTTFVVGDTLTIPPEGTC